MTKEEMKRYRGMVWGCMPQEVREFIDKANISGCLIYSTNPENPFVEQEVFPRVATLSYWHKDLDRRTGEELVGRWCRVWNYEFNPKSIKSVIVKEFSKSKTQSHKYIGSEFTWEHAEEITDQAVIDWLEAQEVE